MLILSALLLFLHNRQEDVQAGQEAESLLENVEAVIETKKIKVPVIGTQPDAAPSATRLDPQMPVVMLDGYEYVGYVEIPVLGLKLPRYVGMGLYKAENCPMPSVRLFPHGRSCHCRA